MYKAPHDELVDGTPTLTQASIINWKPKRRTPNMVTSWGSQVAAKAKSKMSIFLIVLGFHSHKGHQQLCLAPTQHLFHRTGQPEARTHHPVMEGTQWHGTTHNPEGMPSPSHLRWLCQQTQPAVQSCWSLEGFRTQNRLLDLPSPQALSVRPFSRWTLFTAGGRDSPK